jgi:carbonic anhydrase
MKSDVVSADEALKRLVDGNKRYVFGKLMHPNQTRVRRGEVEGGQHPFAIVLGCSDSRVPPEVIFDQGLGDLFVVRVAGNIVDDVVLGSIEYAAEHLHAPLIVVLGHSSCGAVGATVAGGELAGHLPGIADAIRPAVEKTKGQQGDAVNNAAKANAQMVVDQLRSCKPVLAPLVRSGDLKVIAAFCDIGSGKVELL